MQRFHGKPNQCKHLHSEPPLVLPLDGDNRTLLESDLGQQPSSLIFRFTIDAAVLCKEVRAGIGSNFTQSQIRWSLNTENKHNRVGHRRPLPHWRGLKRAAVSRSTYPG